MHLFLISQLRKVDDTQSWIIIRVLLTNIKIIGSKLWPWQCHHFSYSVISGLNMLSQDYLCLCNCLCVCQRVCVQAFNIYNFWSILMKRRPRNPNKNSRWHFSQIWKILLWWHHNVFSPFSNAALSRLQFLFKFSSNLVNYFFNSFLCMGLQPSILG